MCSFDSKYRLRHSYHLRSVSIQDHILQSAFQQVCTKMNSNLKKHLQLLISQEKLIVGDYLKKNKRFKSDAYERFGILILQCELEEVNQDAFEVKTSVCGNDDELLKLDNYLACKTCLQVYFFDSKYGTSTIKKHVCQQQTSKNQPLITEHVSQDLKKADQLPTKTLQLIRDSETKFIVNGMRPFNITENKDFLEFVEIISQVSYKFGKLDAVSVLHSTKSLTDEIAKKAKSVVDDLKLKISHVYGKL